MSITAAVAMRAAAKLHDDILMKSDLSLKMFCEGGCDGFQV